MRYLLMPLLLFLTACDGGSSEQAGPSASPQYHNDYSIGHYIAPANGGYVNSFWIEGPQGVVLIGAQRLPEAALAAVAVAESYTGKKVRMAIVLHASPEQFGGTGVLQQRGIRVVTSTPVAQQIAALQADPPFAVPDIAWDKTGPFEAAGLRLRAYVIRAGQSPSHVLVQLDDHLFVGDLLANRYHAALRPGSDSEQWLERLQEIARFAQPRVIHPGRGYAASAGPLLDQQRAYLQALQQVVATFYSGGEMTPPDQHSMVQRLLHQYPEYGLAGLLDQAIPLEWTRLRRQDHMMLQGQ